MKTRFMRAAVLVLVLVLIVAGCHGGAGVSYKGKQVAGASFHVGQRDVEREELVRADGYLTLAPKVATPATDAD